MADTKITGLPALSVAPETSDVMYIVDDPEGSDAGATSKKITVANLIKAIPAVMKADYDANTILAATTDDTPAAVTVAASTFVGRKATGDIVAMSVSDAQTLLNVEDAADVTDESNVTAAGAVMEKDFDANTILFSTSDNTPAALTVAASTILGRKASGDIDAMTVTEARAILSVEENADVTDATNVDAAGAVMEADFDATTFLYAVGDDTPVTKTRAEVIAILSGQAAADFAMNDNKITGVKDPTDAQDVATKAYADSIAQGLNPLTDAMNAMTTTTLPECTYENGTVGVGATLTADATGALTAQDGITMTLNQYLLVKNQADAIENGVYKLTTLGTAGAAFVFTRYTGMDTDDEIASAFVFVSAGTTGGATSWVCTNEPESVDVGIDDITFGQFNAAGNVTASTGLTKTGNDIAPNGNLEDLHSLGEVASDGQIIVGTGAGTFAYESGATARTSLGLVIGTDVQAYNANLAGGVLNFSTPDAITATEDMSDSDFASNYITLNGTSACAITNWTPTVGKTYFLHCVTDVSNSPTVALSSGITWNGSGTIATFDAVNEFLQVVCISATVVKILANPDSITIT